MVGQPSSRGLGRSGEPRRGLGRSGEARRGLGRSGKLLGGCWDALIRRSMIFISFQRFSKEIPSQSHTHVSEASNP